MHQSSALVVVQRGFTLIEVMIAIVIMAMIAVMTSQAFTVAIGSSEATQEAIDRMTAVDRVWVLLETDMRNVIPAMPRVTRDKPIPPVYIDPSDEYRMTLLRAGYANPLRLPRTEVVRIGYRFEDAAIWRDTWINISENDERNARPQKILEGVTDVFIKALPNNNRASVSGGPWQERWPASGQKPQTLPAAIEITLVTEDFGEIKRIYSILPGIDNSLGGP
ncbi:MAG TPA: type II secretion system minor pseudopilin GspJ [Marinagarivorans sp.]